MEDDIFMGPKRLEVLVRNGVVEVYGNRGGIAALIEACMLAYNRRGEFKDLGFIDSKGDDVDVSVTVSEDITYLLGNRDQPLSEE